MGDQETRLADMLAALESSIRECLTIIDKHEVGSVFVADERTRLVGVVNESDIRKALVAGADLDSSIRELVGQPSTTVTPSHGRAEVLDVMAALRIGEVPVVDGEGRVVGVHVEREMVGARARDNWAVVMAGGRGTRLAPLTDDIPKPMLPVAGRPILERIVLHLVGSGIQRIFLSVNYLGHVVEQYFGDGAKYGCSIEYLREDPERPLGTGGALRLLADVAGPPTVPLLVMNGDLITGFAVDELFSAHESRDVVATIAASDYEHQVPFGVLESVDDGLVRIVEKPTSTWPVNAGIYVLDPSLLGRVPDDELFPITRLFDDCLARGERIGMWQLRDWQDIGRPDELAMARGQG